MYVIGCYSDIGVGVALVCVPLSRFISFYVLPDLEMKPGTDLVSKPTWI